jgi:hypothetical protein
MTKAERKRSEKESDKGFAERWGPLQQNAFDRIKHALLHYPVLAPPDTRLQYVLETDAYVVRFNRGSGV